MHDTATWIWYPGDFEVWLGNKFNNRRTERGAMFPPFWKQDSHWPTVVFTKTYDFEEEEAASIFVEGEFNISLDGRLLAASSSFHIPAGRHTLAVKVWNQATPPSIYIKGTRARTDSTWLATYEDKLWIDEHGVAHGSGVYVPVGSWQFDSPATPPSAYRLPTHEERPASCSDTDAAGRMLGGRLYDFGREVFGSLKLRGFEGGTAHVCYGESREEALDTGHCETLDVIHPLDLHRMADESARTCRLSSKAFRYVFIKMQSETRFDDVAVDIEMSPFDAGRSGTFRCSDDLLNRIWQTSAYTLELTTQEFFMDGIKRDRWVWSGDAIQSYLMNYYLHFDADCVKRTIRQLRGKDPVTAHVNTIMDYTFYWFIGIMDYYQFTGDTAFVREMWPKMVTLMDYVMGRVSDDGMVYGQDDDWIFVDWVDFPMHKRGALCFEQMLFLKALDAMRFFADLIGVACPVSSDSVAALRQTLEDTFWSDGRHAYLHAVEDDGLNPQVTKFPNMFAIIYGIASAAQRRDIMQHVMLNPAVPAITTPYMRFYELEALCMMGLQERVLDEIRNYWGGMLREGATTFWEKYNPAEHGTEHLAMYGRPYGKSLCHAWGASPLYLLGRYFLGVEPVKPGYEEYTVRPVLAGLQWMEGTVPTPFGSVSVSLRDGRVSVVSTGGNGTLIVGDRHIPIPPGTTVETPLV